MDGCAGEIVSLFGFGGNAVNLTCEWSLLLHRGWLYGSVAGCVTLRLLLRAQDEAPLAKLAFLLGTEPISMAASPHMPHK
jgi:hypothetical protein